MRPPTLETATAEDSRRCRSLPHAEPGSAGSGRPRIALNGSIVTELGTQADPEVDAIRVDGKLLHARASGTKIYIALNKPRGYVTTLSDPEGRPTVADLIKGVGRRVYPVGRLDFMSEGLLLLTNDGELARDLMRPGGVEKGYSVKVRGIPDRELLARLAQGIRLEGRKTLPARFRLARNSGGAGGGHNAWLDASVIEGRKTAFCGACSSRSATRGQAAPDPDRTTEAGKAAQRPNGGH